MKKMKNKFKILLSAVLLIVLSISSFTCVYGEEITAEEESKNSAAMYPTAYQKKTMAQLTLQLAENYYYGVEDVDLLYRALCNCIDLGYFDYDSAVEYMMGLLDDKYSEFYSSERFQQLYTSISGEFYGIGVSITLSGDHVVVANVFPNSPAEKSGILPYDLIVSVDGVDIAGMSTADVANLIKREKGNKVDIGIIRNGVPMTVTCYCDEVDQNPISYEILEDGKIGYIYLSTFSLNIDEFLAPVLAEFEEKGITDIILDIRNNGGGELNAAISLANCFVPEGVVAKFKYKNEENNRDLTIENGMSKSPYNLVLLVNENSASASELFTGAVKDRNAGTVIGTKTFGKGSMQTVQTLITGSAVKYTIAEFHSPNDNRIHTVGITPDYVVENSSYKVNEEDFSDAIFENVGDLNDGEHILAIEQRLSALGCMESEADETYDDETKEALMYFQLSKGLEITGVADVYTLVALNDIVYDFEIVNDDQLDAAIEYILTGKIDGYIPPVTEVAVQTIQ